MGLEWVEEPESIIIRVPSQLDPLQSILVIEISLLRVFQYLICLGQYPVSFGVPTFVRVLLDSPSPETFGDLLCGSSIGHPQHLVQRGGL